MAERKRAKKPASAPARARKPRRKKAEPGSTGLTPAEVQAPSPPEAVASLEAEIRSAGGVVLVPYREPFGGHWVVLAALPVDRVEPTPYQRDLSEPHVGRLSEVIRKTGRFLDPILAVAAEGGMFWTPNGSHRLAAVKALGGRTIAALVLPEREVARQILALNTEKAHNLREKSLEVVRMYRALAALEGRPEGDFALEFEDPVLVTLGFAYEQRPRLSGGAYQSFLKRVEAFLDAPLPEALKTREGRSRGLLEVDDLVSVVVQKLKARGFQSPYLKAFVVARVNPVRWGTKTSLSFDEALAKMRSSAAEFDAERVRPQDLARAGGPPDEPAP